MNRIRIHPAAVIIVLTAIALALMAGLLTVRADGDSLPPECPPGLTCEAYPGPYPAPYPAPEFLPIVAGESYP